MSKRIMYSILPSVVEPSQISHTNGIIDYKAMAAAVSGAENIIRLGTKAAVGELIHYGGYGSPSPGKKSRDTDSLGGHYSAQGQKLQAKAMAFIAARDYKSALDLCVRAFDQENKWAKSFGGKAWGKIAECLSKIDSYWRNLAALKTTKSRADLTIVSQQLIIYLNIFDGLSHNTANIMGNLVHEEAMESLPAGQEMPDEDMIENEIRLITRIMDSKELHHSADVYQEIEPTLTGSGDIHRYKDYTRTLNNQSRERNFELREKEMLIIRLRKELLPFRHELMTATDLYKNVVDGLDTNQDNDGMQADKIMRVITVRLSGVISDYDDKEIPGVKSYIDKVKTGIRKMLDAIAEGLRKQTSPRNKLKSATQLMYYLDSI